MPKDIVSAVVLSRQVKAFRGTPQEFAETFGDDVARRASYEVPKGWGSDGYRYVLSVDRCLARKWVQRYDDGLCGGQHYRLVVKD